MKAKTVVPVRWHCKDPTKRVCLVQSGYDHLVVQNMICTLHDIAEKITFTNQNLVFKVRMRYLTMDTIGKLYNIPFRW